MWYRPAIPKVYCADTRRSVRVKVRVGLVGIVDFRNSGPKSYMQPTFCPNEMLAKRLIL